MVYKIIMNTQSTKNVKYSILSTGFFRCYFITMRPYLLFVSGIAGLSGMALIPDISIRTALIAFIPFFLSYGLGQALTDVFQTDTDSISSPYRPLVKGEISKRDVFAVSLTGLFLSVLILVVYNPIILVPGTLAVIGLATYTPLKRKWWGGPVWNSWIVALLPLMARYIDSTFYFSEKMLPPEGEGIYLFYTMAALFFAYSNFVIMGYFKDISADKATGYNTFIVAFGWKAGAILSDVVSLLAAIFTYLAIAPKVFNSEFNIFGLIPFILAVVLNLFAQIKIHIINDEKIAYKPIGNVIRAFLLYGSSIVLAYKPHWHLYIIIFYLLYEIVVFVRTEKTQL